MSPERFRHFLIATNFWFICVKYLVRCSSQISLVIPCKLRQRKCKKDNWYLVAYIYLVHSREWCICVLFVISFVVYCIAKKFPTQSKSISTKNSSTMKQQRWKTFELCEISMCLMSLWRKQNQTNKHRPLHLFFVVVIITILDSKKKKNVWK